MSFGFWFLVRFLVYSGSSFLDFLTVRVRSLRGRGHFNATVYCQGLCGDLLQFRNNRPVPFSHLSCSFLVRCGNFLISEKLLHGSMSCCVHVLQSICGGTYGYQLLREQLSFDSICANISIAQGHTIARRRVIQVLHCSLSRCPTLRFIHSVFVFDCYVHKVPFISITFLQ